MNYQMCIIYGEGNWYVSGENKKGRLKPAFKGAGQTPQGSTYAANIQQK